MSIRLNLDQARHFVRPDLGSNCLQWLSADTFLLLSLYLSTQADRFEPVHNDMCINKDSDQPGHQLNQIRVIVVHLSGSC